MLNLVAWQDVSDQCVHAFLLGLPRRLGRRGAWGNRTVAAAFGLSPEGLPGGAPEAFCDVLGSSGLSCGLHGASWDFLGLSHLPVTFCRFLVRPRTSLGIQGHSEAS